MADNAVTPTFKKVKTINSLYRTTGTIASLEFTILVPSAAVADETYTTTIPVLPAGTIVTGCYVKSSTAFGGTATIALKSTTTGAIFAAAGTNNQTADVFASKTITTAQVTSTADEKVTLTVAAANGPTVSGGVTITILLAIIGCTPETTVTTYTA
jgi:hypothetical protein